MFNTRIINLLVVLALLAMALTACGGGNCEGLNDVDCNTPGTQLAGEAIVDTAINAAANANGDGVADTTHCDNIVC